MEKKCTRCNIIKELSQFRESNNYKLGVVSECRECDKERSNEYYRNNKEKIKEREKIRRSSEEYKLTRKNYLENNREEINRVKKLYKLNNREKVLQEKKDYYQRKKNDPIFALTKRLRQGIYRSIRGVKLRSSLDILGCTEEEFKIHIESQFTEGMSWDSLGDIHIDHIIPISSAQTMEEIYKLNHYTNLQPLWAKDNLVKHNKMM